MKRIGFMFLMIIFLISCNQETVTNKENDNQISSVENNVNEKNENALNHEDNTQEEIIENEMNEDPEEQVVTPEETIEEVIDFTGIYQEHHVNEAGQIMILMYHDLKEKPGTYATTIELFKKDLERLYEEGYRTISMSDLIHNDIHVPLGTTPVVLTFDDATLSNFYYDEAGEISKDSVVGILDEFYRNHEDFGRNAIFYVYGQNPFREKDLLQEKLSYLIENGYEIGNHSWDHEKLNTLDETGLLKAIGKEHGFIKEAANYEMQHVSLPYGIKPSESLFSFVFDGTYEGVTYHNVSAVNVGWNPVKSPIHANFNPQSLNRITCGEDQFELNYWLDYFKDHPEKRYYSDGDAETNVIPSVEMENISDAFIDKITIYDKEEQ
ncbi:MAG: polysaccharide deacetylase family protein [Clostridia bacterium]|nr:polysaccharide deacetylase family protein [Clostridia bacterium]